TLTSCTMVRRQVHSGEPLQVMELGAAETRKEPIPPESAAMSHFLAATLAMNRGDYDEASDQFEQSVAADPHSAMLRQRLAAIYVRRGRLADALEQCQAAVVIAPDDPESRMMLADVLSTLGRDDEAIREYETVLS